MPNPNRNQHNPPSVIHPAPADLRKARERARHSVEQAAKSVYITPTKWRELEASDARRMHPATWELYLLKTRQIDLDTILDRAAALAAGVHYEEQDI